MTFQDEAAARRGVAWHYSSGKNRPVHVLSAGLQDIVVVLIRWEVLGTRQPEIEFLRRNDCQVVDNAWKFFSLQSYDLLWSWDSHGGDYRIGGFRGWQLITRRVSPMAID